LIRWLIYIAVFGLIMRGSGQLRLLRRACGGVPAWSSEWRSAAVDVNERSGAICSLGAGLFRIRSFGFMVLKYLQNI